MNAEDQAVEAVLAWAMGRKEALAVALMEAVLVADRARIAELVAQIPELAQLASAFAPQQTLH